MIKVTIKQHIPNFKDIVESDIKVERMTGITN